MITECRQKPPICKPVAANPNNLWWCLPWVLETIDWDFQSFKLLPPKQLEIKPNQGQFFTIWYYLNFWNHVATHCRRNLPAKRQADWRPTHQGRPQRLLSREHSAVSRVNGDEATLKGGCLKNGGKQKPLHFRYQYMYYSDRGII